MESFEHDHYEGRVRGRRARRSNDDLVLVRDHQGHGPELHIKPEEFLRDLLHLPPRSPENLAHRHRPVHLVAWEKGVSGYR